MAKIIVRMDLIGCLAFGQMLETEREIERLGEGKGEGEVQIKVVADDAGILKWDSLIL